MHGRTLLLFASWAGSLLAAPVPTATVDRLDATIIEPRHSLSIGNLIRSIMPSTSFYHAERNAEVKTEVHVDDIFEDANTSRSIGTDRRADVDERGLVGKGGQKRGFVGKGGQKRGFVGKGGQKRGFVGKGGQKRGFVGKGGQKRGFVGKGGQKRGFVGKGGQKRGFVGKGGQKRDSVGQAGSD